MNVFRVLVILDDEPVIFILLKLGSSHICNDDITYHHGVNLEYIGGCDYSFFSDVLDTVSNARYKIWKI